MLELPFSSPSSQREKNANKTFIHFSFQVKITKNSSQEGENIPTASKWNVLWSAEILYTSYCRQMDKKGPEQASLRPVNMSRDNASFLCGQTFLGQKVIEIDVLHWLTIK